MSIIYDIEKDEAVKKDCNTQPMLLLSVYVNEEYQIEEYNLLQQFVGGKYGRYLESESDSYDDYSLKNSGLIDIIKESGKDLSDCLFHVYVRIDTYSCGSWECEEYEDELSILKVILVQENYRDFLESEEHFQEQQELKEKDDIFGTLVMGGWNGGGYCYEPLINYYDLVKLAQMVSQTDIRLAHKLLPCDGFHIKEAQEVLGDLYSEDIMKIEYRKEKFRKYLRYNENLKTEFDKNGYKIVNNNYHDLPREQIYITREMVDELDDEIYRTMKNEEILEHFFNSILILKTFDESEVNKNGK